jgi:hypothetical protein
MFSFAVAIIVALVLFYFAASVVSLSEYHAAGQKRLQLQVLAQAYNDTPAVYDDAVIDAILDSAYSSGTASACNPSAAGSLADALAARAQSYVSGATANLTAAFDNTAVPALAWSASSLSVQSGSSQTLTPSCYTNGSLLMSLTTATVAFPLNVTSQDGSTGAFSRPFNRSYDILVNYSNANRSFTVLVRRDGNELRCVNVAC